MKNLKQLFLFLILAGTLLFSACSNTDLGANDDLVIDSDGAGSNAPQTAEEEVDQSFDQDLIVDDTTDDIEIGSLI